MPETTPRVDVTSWDLLGLEPAGLEAHPWIADPDGTAWLFRPVVTKNGHRQGEDWADTSVSRIAAELGVPCAEVTLAERARHPGSISRDAKPRGWDIQPGATILSALVPDYATKTKYRVGHSLHMIEQAIAEATSPPGCGVPPGFTAFDVFSGFLTLDALVANGDRHDENWAVLVPPGTKARIALCPSFDHASSLGFNLTDKERERRIAEGSVRQWAERGVARRFEHHPGQPIETLVDLAVRALMRCDAAVRDHWMGAVSALGRSVVEDRVSRCPAMSDQAVTFAVELTSINRERLLETTERAVRSR